MQKKILIGSIFAALLILLLPLSSVVGTHSTEERKTICSPLFENRVKLFTQQEPREITAQYLGKGHLSQLFIPRQSSIRQMVNRAIKLIETNPSNLTIIADTMESNPALLNLLKEHEITHEEFKYYVNLVQNDPTLIQQLVNEVVDPVDNDPEHMGLSTSNPLGCFIVAIALIPAILIIALLIGTLTIITCLNIGGCLETLFNNIGESILGGLTPP